MIAIIDYGAGNIRSIEKALEHVGAKVQVTDDPAVVAAAQAVVLPGVGSGGTAMARMIERGLDGAIRQATEQGKPFLGICLGMQLLADHHAEGEVDGLGLFAGEVRRIPHGPKIPHMGWNQVRPLHSGLAIFEGGEWMIILPAIDIKDGQCVRLYQGDYAQVTTYAADPVEVAQRWQSEGASWLHVVDLDGAAAGHPVNIEI